MFSGTFDGKNHKISNLTINKSSSDYVGLFGVLSTLATLKNVGIENANISGKDNVGALVGRTLGEVRNAYVTGIVSGADKIGGLIGDNNGRLYDSYSTATVTGNRFIGGLVGNNSGGQIYNSYATGSVSGSENIGGLTGYNYSDIRNSYATGNVTGGIRVGGFVGANGGFISNSYATGNLSGEGEIGGFSGFNYDGYGRITSSYWNSDSDIKESNIPQNPKLGVGSDNVVTIAKTVVEMKSDDFAQLLNSNRGALEAEWLLASNTNNGFPTFSLMGSGGDEGNSESESGREVDIIGNITPTTIIVTVPTTLSFAIKPDSENDPFISAPFSMENQSNSPIEVSFLGFQSKAGTSAKVVNVDKYAEWSKLPISKSETEIALGLNTDGKTIWAPAETTEMPNTVVDTIMIDRLGTKEFELDGKHGMAFTQPKVFGYTMYIRVGLAS
nr:GLUG motif-containing protein [Paenibacillus turicensis]